MTASYQCTVSPAEIRAQRRRLGLKQAALAELVSVNQATVSRWESGLVPIDSNNWTHLQELSRQRCVVSDWPTEFSNAKTEGQWPALLKQFRLVRNLSQEQLADLSGYAAESISRWETGRFTPNLSAQLKLRDLILSPLDTDSQFQRLRDRVFNNPGRISLQWENFVVTCSQELRRNQRKRGYDVSMLSNLEELHNGKYGAWIRELGESCFLRANAPLTEAWFEHSKGDARRMNAHSVSLADGNTFWLAIHSCWNVGQGHRDGEFSILHADELIQ